MNRKMAKGNITYQQRLWILDDYQSIIEDPESYGYPNIEEHMDEVIADIKEDVEQVFCCKISEGFIKFQIKVEYGR
jgi:hypothetical protein